jgi:transposase
VTMTELLSFSRPAMASTLAEVGLMLAEAKALLAKLQASLLCGQVNEYAAHCRVCPACGVLRPLKDRRTRRLQTLFGTVEVEAPRIRVCRCRLTAPMAEVVALLEIGIRKAEADILAWHKAHEASRRLATIPGVGPITASAIAATVPDARLFRSGRQFAAWLGLTPQPRSSGGKERLGRVSRQGNAYIRRLLVTGMTAVLRHTRADSRRNPWVAKLLERKPARLVTVALANKTARVAWAMLMRGESYAAPAA